MPTLTTAPPLVSVGDKFEIDIALGKFAGEVIETRRSELSSPLNCGCRLDNGKLVELDSLKVACAKITN
tara:strand:+ start:2844 stop:3050 length:207 start_codon:yes stop_codon:yes gene_type:complete